MFTALVQQLKMSFPDWHLHACLQGYTQPVPGLDSCLMFDEPLGIYMARYTILKAVHSDIYCQLDDDMQIIPQTKFNHPALIEKLMQCDTGCISCNYIRALTPALIARARTDPVFLPKIIMSISGGLLFNSTVAPLFLDIPPKMYSSDDEVIWGLMTYVNGYTNYRFTGSLLVHKLGQPGAHKTQFSTISIERPDSRLLTVRNGNPNRKIPPDNNYLFPIDADVTPYARELHARNLKPSSKD